jgi:hypothetical protein
MAIPGADGAPVPVLILSRRGRSPGLKKMKVAANGHLQVEETS